MKRALLLAVMLFGSAVVLNAQYNSISYDSNSAFKLLQIDQYDDASVFFFKVEGTDDRQAFSVNDNTKISVEGVFKKYKLVQTANIPFTSENMAAVVEGNGNDLYFILQFDRLPLDKPFRMVENEKSSSRMTFNFDNVTVDTSRTVEKINVEDFLGYSDYVKFGTYSQNGKKYAFYDINGLSVATHLGEEFLGLTRVGKLDVVITNDSGHRISVSSDNIKVTATKNEKKGYVEIPLWSVSTYDSYVEGSNASSVYSYSSRSNPVASSISDYRRFKVRSDDLGSQIILGSLEMAFRSINRDQVDEYAEALEKNREHLWNNYLQSIDLDDGESYGGYVAFKDQKYKRYKIIVKVGGREYTFSIAG
ncbi:MAG: hypothetical protein KBS58_03010 [Bacteroidales bacterium]|nr:hypothetical protein [Candidatus Cacconaster equi]